MIWINNGCSNVYDAVQKKTGNAEKILNPRREYCVTNMRELAFLLKKYAKADILVTIIGDYDCDGVCASAELHVAEKNWIFKRPDTAAKKNVRRIRVIGVDCG